MRTPSIERSLKLLHPEAIQLFESFAAELLLLDETRGFKPFETYRTPMRQIYLKNLQPPLTRNPPWISAHQYGMAVDFVWQDQQTGDWTWDIADTHYNALANSAKSIGLNVPVKWDKGHVELLHWRSKVFPKP